MVMLFAVLTVGCWLVWHWSQYSTMVLLIEDAAINLPNKKIPTTGKRRKSRITLNATSTTSNTALSNHTTAETILAITKSNSTPGAAVDATSNATSREDTATHTTQRKKKKTQAEEEDISSYVYNDGPIFYNLYIPSFPRMKNVRAIVLEQLAEHKAITPNSTILYTLIANKHATTMEQLINNTCPEKCKQRTRLVSGDEVDTLQALWEYCRSDKVPSSVFNDTLISYIHDKGSFHNNNNNVRSRQMGTRSTLVCRNQMPTKPSGCNICASLFQVVPQFHGSAKYVIRILFLGNKNSEIPIFVISQFYIGSFLYCFSILLACGVQSGESFHH